MKVVMLSALHTGHLYSPGNIPCTHFCLSLSQPQGHGAAGRIMSMKLPMTPSGIEPETFRLVARCLNQPRHRVSPEGKYPSAIRIRLSVLRNFCLKICPNIIHPCTCLSLQQVFPLRLGFQTKLFYAFGLFYSKLWHRCSGRRYLRLEETCCS